MAVTWRTVRVFISSTFRDMHAERDYLVRVVFPALREKLLRYRIYLDDIDLRWGVTQEQADRDMALDLCLEQIDRSRPFFLGILGERYGYVPESFSEEAVSKYGWVQHETGKSITELEILYGVLRKRAMQPRALFFFRDPAFINDLPEPLRLQLVEEGDQSEDSPGSKLASLRKAILGANLPIPPAEYPCRFAGLRINWRVAQFELAEADMEALKAVAAAMIFELVKDFSTVLSAIPTEHPKHHILRLLEEAIRRDVRFIARRAAAGGCCVRVRA